jgi:ubiquinone/menaquinone biosynthesis C-methylase UbiE
MGLKSFIVRQLGNPHGWFSPITARFLNKGNAQQNADCIDALHLEPHHRVLEVGFGGGVSVPRLLSECAQGRITGCDISSEMILRAQSRFSEAIQAGKLEVVEGSVADLALSEASFDRVMSVNTVYFWPDLEAGLKRILFMLAPSGFFVTSVVPARMLKKVGFEGEGYRAEDPEFYQAAFERAGFVNVMLTLTGDSKGSVLVRGDKP